MAAIVEEKEGVVTVSLVVPCFNEERNLDGLVAELVKHCSGRNREWEYLFIDDGSSDGTLEKLREVGPSLGHKVAIIEFSRNFGKEAAIMAGLENANGDVVIVMDADLQDPPSLIGPMVSAVLEEGFDMAATCRTDRTDEPAIRSLLSRMFYVVWNFMTSNGLVQGARDFRALSRPVVDCVVALRETNRFSKGIFEWVGFRTKYFPFENRARKEGESGWSFRGLVSYALDGILSFSVIPLRFASVCGVAVSVCAFLWMGWVIFKTLLFGDPVAGYPSLVTILLFVSGIQLLCLGIIGEYLGRTYQEAKARPHYLVRKIHQYHGEAED